MLAVAVNETIERVRVDKAAMTGQSKLAYSLGLPVLMANCYETIYTWNPDCNQAILVTSLLAKKGNVRRINWKRYCKDVVRSSIFLSCNARIRFFTPTSMGLLSSLFGSFFSLWVEKRSRWPALALYLTNLASCFRHRHSASETLFRQLSNHDFIPTVQNGEVIPFVVGLGLFSYLYSVGKLDASSSKIFNLTHNIAGARDIVEEWPLPKEFKGFLSELRMKYGRTEHCEHKHSFVSVATEAVRCSLNRLPHSTPVYRNVIAGTASGLAMLAFPNVSISMYVLWKAIEVRESNAPTTFYNLVKEGRIHPMPYGDLFLYTIVIEPQSFRKGYLKFLLGLTGNRMGRNGGTTRWNENKRKVYRYHCVTKSGNWPRSEDPPEGNVHPPTENGARKPKRKKRTELRCRSEQKRRGGGPGGRSAAALTNPALAELRTPEECGLGDCDDCWEDDCSRGVLVLHELHGDRGELTNKEGTHRTPNMGAHHDESASYRALSPHGSRHALRRTSEKGTLGVKLNGSCHVLEKLKTASIPFDGVKMVIFPKLTVNLEVISGELSANLIR
ncbi:unnamed protein product [Heligmosomoides polygyrus]|uniref:TMEM135_C_rich domain-containing protein n=1 Tax=Heligmosomoides polygyrus TaxID=6339 RepID=A0A3P7ZP12_HELPZ|nr:unnamed protein product [Heligmosomoides polygyrus]